MCRRNKSRAITPTEEAAGNTPEDFLSLKGPSPSVISLFHKTTQKADSGGKEMARGSSFCRVSIVEGGLFAKGRTPPQCLRSHFCKSAKGINAAGAAGVEIEAIDIFHLAPPLPNICQECTRHFMEAQRLKPGCIFTVVSSWRFINCPNCSWLASNHKITSLFPLA